MLDETTYYPHLLRLAGTVLNGSDLAQDAVQEAYLAYYEGAKDTSKSPLALLRGIVRFKAIDLLRKERSFTGVDEEMLSTTEPSFVGNLILDEAVKLLSPLQLQAFTLVMCEGESQDQAAVAMNLSQGAVSKLLAGANEVLRGALL